jgi:hypothetical protein
MNFYKKTTDSSVRSLFTNSLYLQPGRFYENLFEDTPIYHFKDMYIKTLGFAPITGSAYLAKEGWITFGRRGRVWLLNLDRDNWDVGSNSSGYLFNKKDGNPILAREVTRSEQELLYLFP